MSLPSVTGEPDRARQQQHSFPVAPDETPKTSPTLLAFLRKKGPEPSWAKVSLSHPSREFPTHSCAAPPFAGTSAAGQTGWQRRCLMSPSWCSHQSPPHPAGKGHWDTQPGSLSRAGELLHQPGLLPVPTPPRLLRLGRTQGLSLWDESMQSLALPCQHQPDLISIRAPSAPAASAAAQGSHARLRPPLPPPSTHKHSHRGAQSTQHIPAPASKGTSSRTHQVDEGAPRVPKLQQRRESMSRPREPHPEGYQPEPPCSV